jgi:hypothetical protein
MPSFSFGGGVTGVSRYNGHHGCLEGENGEYYVLAATTAA